MFIIIIIILIIIIIIIIIKSDLQQDGEFGVVVRDVRAAVN
jgi:hypothetical protein